MKKVFVILSVSAFMLSTTSCLIKTRVCNCTYTDSTGTVNTTSEEYIGGAVGTSKKAQQADCDNNEAALQSQFASASCELN